MSASCRAKARIVNRLGLHARPAAHFVRLAARFVSDVYVARDSMEVNGKSIMGVMMLAAEEGAEIEIRAEGEDAEKVVEELVALVERGFDEDDEGRPIRPGEDRDG
ncbi:MAG TPA: HPr family phosphocarrier protein [Gemmatimonadota bacterium]|nr:HPr family phosphocarrier protein [Gemmatimonadota bacterium]